MNTKPSKITLKKQDLPPHSPRLGIHENYLLADYFTLISLRILGKFFRNFSEMLKSIFSLCRDPLPSIKIGGEGGQSSASKAQCVTDVTGKYNLHTCNLHYLLIYIHGFTQILSEACRLRLNINCWLIKNNIRITTSNLRERERRR